MSLSCWEGGLWWLGLRWRSSSGGVGRRCSRRRGSSGRSAVNVAVALAVGVAVAVDVGVAVAVARPRAVAVWDSRRCGCSPCGRAVRSSIAVAVAVGVDGSSRWGASGVGRREWSCDVAVAVGVGVLPLQSRSVGVVASRGGRWQSQSPWKLRRCQLPWRSRLRWRGSGSRRCRSCGCCRSGGGWSDGLCRSRVGRDCGGEVAVAVAVDVAASRIFARKAFSLPARVGCLPLDAPLKSGESVTR